VRGVGGVRGVMETLVGKRLGSCGFFAGCGCVIMSSLSRS
jgi:hypothetical protein